MARLPRLCVPGWPHLLIQRGHGGQPVFRDDADAALFLDLLRQAAVAHGAAIHAYGLLETEVRLLLTPSAPDSLSRMMQAIGRRYGSSFNRRHGQVGGLWEGRFRATIVEPERHLLRCMRFVEAVPKNVRLGSDEGQVDWSSAAHHAGERTNPLISDHLQYWTLGNTPFEREAAYKEMNQQALTQDEESLILNATRKGWPLGSEAFVSELSANTDRRLAPLPRGRPPKTTSQAE